VRDRDGVTDLQRGHGKVTFVADGDTLDVDIDADGRGARRTRIIASRRWR
jgi:hypothetical protein